MSILTERELIVWANDEYSWVVGQSLNGLSPLVLTDVVDADT